MGFPPPDPPCETTVQLSHDQVNHQWSNAQWPKTQNLLSPTPRQRMQMVISQRMEGNRHFIRLSCVINQICHVKYSACSNVLYLDMTPDQNSQCKCYTMVNFYFRTPTAITPGCDVAKIYEKVGVGVGGCGCGWLWGVGVCRHLCVKFPFFDIFNQT